MSKMWMVRSGRESKYIDDFLSQNIVAIGWGLKQLTKNVSKAEIQKQYRSLYPEATKGQVSANSGQILRFYAEFSIKDNVVTYDRDRRLYFMGEIVSDVEWHPEISEDMPTTRSVEWTHQIARDSLSISTKNSLGSIATLFQIKGETLKELNAKKRPIGSEVEIQTFVDESSQEKITKEQLLEEVEQEIEDRISKLSWEDMEELVAGILRAMGYRTTVSPRGADRGVDIFASPDGLGLEEPRIFVEVKHRPNSTMGSQQIRSFLGGRSQGDRCLYVSTGGFSKDARYEADRSNIPIRLLTLVDLRRLLVENYEHLDESARSFIPLRRIYVVD